MKKIIFSIVGMSLIALNNVNAINPGGSNVNPNIVTAGSADVVVQRYVANTMMFLYLAAVLFGLFGGFNILTAGGDEEKVKKGKTIIINALIGLVVIFLVGTVVELLVKSILV